jgi:hypothetical protein
MKPMENLDFKFYSVTSVPFGLLTAAFIVGGVHSPKLVAVRLNRSNTFKLIVLVIAASGLSCVATCAWMIFTKLEFFQHCLRELLTCYTIGFWGGIIGYKLDKK